MRAAEQLQSDIVQSGSAQLVNVAMAAHWFDLPLFYKEVDKVLCPNGILAMSAYSEIPSFEPCGTKASAEITSAHETVKMIFLLLLLTIPNQELNAVHF